MNLSGSANSRFFIGFLISSLLFGSASFAVNAVNTPESGYVLCVNKKTQAVTFPGTDKCPKGSTQLLLGAQGIPGIKGDKGDTGLAGVNGAAGAQGPTGAVGAVGAVGAIGPTGARGSSLLTGVGTPSNQLGNNGDTYIDKNAAHIYGPKTSGLWGNPTAFGGPAGPQGPIGVTGAAGLSNAYADFSSTPTNLNGTQAFLCHTSSFQLPAGDYFVIANANASAPSGFGLSSQFNIYIKIGDKSSPSVMGSYIDNPYPGSETSIWAFSSVAAGSNVQVFCDSSSNLRVNGVSLVAIKIGSVSATPIG